MIFHRVIPGFVIQGGDGQHGKKASLNAGQVGHRRTRLQVRGRADQGRLRARRARDGERRARTRTARQFFICHQDLTGKLPKNYTIFGQVTKGLDIVDQIAGAPRNARDLPDEPVAMKSVTIFDD